MLLARALHIVALLLHALVVFVRKPPKLSGSPQEHALSETALPQYPKQIINTQRVFRDTGNCFTPLCDFKYKRCRL